MHLANFWCLLTKSTTHYREQCLENAKPRLKWSKSKLVLLLVLKHAIGLKTSYGDAFGKPLVFVDQTYHTLENNVIKTQKLD